MSCVNRVSPGLTRPETFFRVRTVLVSWRNDCYYPNNGFIAKPRGNDQSDVFTSDKGTVRVGDLTTRVLTDVLP